MAGFRTLGTPPLYYGGASLPDSMHVYPDNFKLVLLDTIDGSPIGSADTPYALTSSTACNFAGDYALQLLEHVTVPSEPSALLGYLIDRDAPSPLELKFNLPLEISPVHAKISSDGNGTMYFPDDSGNVYRVAFNKDLPIDASNPVITQEKKLDPADTYYYNSFAIGSGVAYIVSEQNVIYAAAASL
jgi:hypothetical protein